MTRIILADDDALVLQGLSLIVGSQADIQLCGTAANGREAVALCRRERPDVAVLDIRMPHMDGIEAARLILAEKLAVPLLLTTFDEPELIARGLEVGAGGYILKNSPAQRILSAIGTVAAGGAVFAPDVLDYIRSVTPLPRAQGAFRGLTPRELEIVQLVAEGLSNGEIAARLYLSDGTVRNHISNILEKTGLTHRTQIAVRYYQNNRPAAN